MKKEFDYTNTNCCACGKYLGKQSNINLVETRWRKTWRYPQVNNFFLKTLKDDDHATAILCDDCIEAKATPKFVVEFADELIIRHPVSELERIGYKVVVWFTESYGSGAGCICSLCHKDIPEGEVPLRAWQEHKEYEGGMEMIACEACTPGVINKTVDYSMWAGMLIAPGFLDNFLENKNERLQEAEDLWHEALVKSQSF